MRLKFQHTDFIDKSSQSRNNRSAKTPPQNNSGSRGLALVVPLKELGVAAAFLDTFSAEGKSICHCPA